LCSRKIGEEKIDERNVVEDVQECGDIDEVVSGSQVITRTVGGCCHCLERTPAGHIRGPP
jgi:hypothetical protein